MLFFLGDIINFFIHHEPCNITLYCGLIQLTTSYVHLLCASLSALVVLTVCCEGVDICGQGQQTAFT